MQKIEHQIYSFGEFTLDVTRGCLLRDSSEIKLRPKSFDVLKFLTENAGRLVSKDELIGVVWEGMAVTDDSLVQCLKDIRNALDDRSQTYIKTVPRRGYIFEKDVEENGAGIYFEETSGVHLVIEESERTNGFGETVGVERDLAVGRRSLLDVARRNKWPTALALGTLILVTTGIAYGLFVVLRRPPAAPFTSVTMSRLTNDGKSAGGQVSPDGKYFAYVLQEGGRESVWVRQVAAVNNVQVVPTSDVAFNGLKFSPDGASLYYVQGNVLYQTGTLGGSARKLWENVASGITISPDGKRLAFIRPGTGDGLGSRVIVANSDGTGEEQILANRKPPESFTTGGCSWSPDGETLVCSAGDNPLFGQQFPLAIKVSDGSQTPLTKGRWNMVRQAAWLHDGSGFIMSAWANDDAGAQLWHVAYPDGAATKIYSDLNDYRSASLTADSRTLLATQREPRLNVHVMKLSGERESRQLTFSTSGRTGFAGISSMPDGSILYSSEDGGTRDLWIMNPDGTGQRRLTFDGPMESNVSLSPDGHSFVYGVASQGIWRTDLDGGNRRQLTPYGMFPAYSADGKWVFYTLPRDTWTMWKVPAEGGEPVRVTDHPAIQPDVSPDGKLIAYMNMNSLAGSKAKLYVVRVEGGEPVLTFDSLPLGQFNIRWAPDGKAIAYKANENGIQIIVSQPLEGGQPQILLAAKSESEGIAGWGFSRDGKELYYSTGPLNHNVVMFTLEK